MFFYLLFKKILNQVRNPNYTKEEKKDDFYILKHAYIAVTINAILSSPVLTLLFELYLCVIGLMLWMISLKTQIYILLVFIILILILIVISGIIFMKRMKCIKEGKDTQEFLDKILDKLLNIYLINPIVISYKDWKKIKKVSRKNYDEIISIKSIAQCYEATFYIANVVKNKNVKIIWLLCSMNKEKFGHSVLAKGNYIYDTNRRKTYNKKKYLKHYNAKVYKEITLDEYLIKNPKDMDLLLEEGLNSRAVYINLEKDWEKFKTFCEENEGLRCCNDKK